MGPLLFLIPALFVAGFIAIFVMVFFSFVSQRSMMARVLDHVSSQVGGVMKDYGNQKRLVFQENGVRFVVSLTRSDGTTMYRASAPWSDPKFRVKVFKDVLSPELKKFIGMQDVVIGSADFDNKYVIQTNDTAHVVTVLTPEAQHEIVRLGTDVSLSIVGGEVILELRVFSNNDALISNLTKRFVDTYFALVAGMSADGSIEMTLVEAEDSVCMVCGERVVERKIFCHSCNTPHHQECWEYLGQCSTYACGQKKFRQVARTRNGLFRI